MSKIINLFNYRKKQEEKAKLTLCSETNTLSGGRRKTDQGRLSDEQQERLDNLFDELKKENHKKKLKLEQERKMHNESVKRQYQLNKNKE